MQRKWLTLWPRSLVWFCPHLSHLHLSHKHSSCFRSGGASSVFSPHKDQEQHNRPHLSSHLVTGCRAQVWWLLLLTMAHRVTGRRLRQQQPVPPGALRHLGPPPFLSLPSTCQTLRRPWSQWPSIYPMGAACFLREGTVSPTDPSPARPPHRLTPPKLRDFQGQAVHPWSLNKGLSKH